jgi:hypothetical protein
MRPLHYTCCAALSFLLAAELLLPAALKAGGSESEMQDSHENGAPFFGEAKDVSTMKPVQGAVIKGRPTIGRGATISINTNIEGRFRLLGFGKGVDPASIEITCAKPGYKTLDVIRRRIASDADAPVEIECLLDPQS